MARFLTIRWNNALTLALGLPALVYVAAVLLNPAWSGQDTLIGLAIIGVLY